MSTKNAAECEVTLSTRNRGLGFAMAVVVGVTVSAGGSVVEPEVPTIEMNEVAITLERTACLGACPAYTIRLSGTGHVEYEGRRYVAVTGVRTGSVDEGQFLALLREFLRVRFFDALERYDGVDTITKRADGLLQLITLQSTDLPSAILTLEMGDRSKTVVLRDNYPSELNMLANEIDRVAKVAHWVESSDLE